MAGRARNLHRFEGPGIETRDVYALTRGLLIEIPARRYVVDWARTYEEGAAAIRRDRIAVVCAVFGRLGANRALR